MGRPARQYRQVEARLPLAILLLLGSLISVAGCGSGAASNGGYGYGSDYAGENEIHFKDDVATNSKPGDSLLKLEFVDSAGKKVSPRDYVGKKNLVLVFTRGYNGSICPYCSTYTSSLITNYPVIAERNAEVVVVYPIRRPNDMERLSDFLAVTYKRSTPAATQTPFPVVLDIELKAVDALGIRRDLSKPATYILDKSGQVRFAYVGSTLSDRPSIKSILEQLDALKHEPS